MRHLPHLITDLAPILGAAAIRTLIFKWQKQPLVLGYIIADLQRHGATLSTTLSIRSMNFADSSNVTKIDYYDTNGNLVKKFIDKTMQVKPMQTI